jgi:undecaprenyl diphosphate synthase
VTDAEQQAVIKTQGNLPRHIAVIMDGNGRWAKQNGLTRIIGHRHGVESVRELVRASAELGLEVLSLYVFSTENWNRPRQEVIGLMRLLRQTVLRETDELNENNVRLRASGRIDELPRAASGALREAIEITSKNTGLILNLCINYSGRAELIDAVKALVQAGHSADEITPELLSSHLYTSDLPEPDLLIRTSGEVRISNFLLWQTAYTELWFTPVFWPDFRRPHLYEAIAAYQQRQRRFGKTQDQLFGEPKRGEKS